MSALMDLRMKGYGEPTIEIVDTDDPMGMFFTTFMPDYQLTRVVFPIESVEALLEVDGMAGAVEACVPCSVYLDPINVEEEREIIVESAAGHVLDQIEAIVGDRDA